MDRDVNRDNYDEVINGEDTYNTIAKKLLKGDAVFIGWTDEKETHLDILFKYGAFRPYHNITQFGIRPTNLFISIIKIGSFAFDTDYKKSPSYYAEKLFSTTNLNYEFIEKLSNLFNGVIESLNRGNSNE